MRTGRLRRGSGGGTHGRGGRWQHGKPCRWRGTRQPEPREGQAGPAGWPAGRRVETGFTGFNVSHSGRHGLIAIGGQGCLGVDLEERVPERDLEGIGGLVYGPAERRLLGNATGRERVHLFYRLWSMKEALIKALGTGFSLSPTGFQVPAPMLRGARSGLFRFPHLPSQSWRLLDLGEPRFAAALAYRLPSTSGPGSTPPGR